MDIPQCQKLKDSYDECSKDLVPQFFKDFNVKNFFACDHLFQDYKDCYDVGIVDKLRDMRLMKEKREKEAKEKEANAKK